MRALATAFIGLAGVMLGAAGPSAPQIRSASIAEGEAFGFSPFFYQVEYSAPVRISAVTLTNLSERRAEPMDFTPRATPSRAHAIALPVLAPHSYRLTWRATGPDGATVSGAVAFSVAGCLTPPGAAQPIGR